MALTENLSHPTAEASDRLIKIGHSGDALASPC